MLPKTYIASDHDIDPAQIDADAQYVLKKLHEAGYKAYLVGGGVRDLLFKRVPKDFDISTSARPEEIKRLFGRQCLLIGRRFRLAHIRFGKKIIEVSTFRSGENEDDLIIRDNQWGSAEEDVLRRDFTINGLFYDPTTHSVIDYVGGWDDIHNKLLRTIGNPSVRFRQDPVRMIRLLKFRARFGFEVDPKTRDALIENRKEITKSSPARILEELLRMLESGHSAHFMHLLHQSGLLSMIIPKLSEFLEKGHQDRVFELLSTADALNQSPHNRPIDRTVLTSCLLYPILEKAVLDKESATGIPCNMGEIILLTNDLIKEVVMTSFTHFPRRLSATMAYVLATQSKLHTTCSKQKFRLRIMNNKEFPLALKLFQIRALTSKDLFDTYSHWQKLYQNFEKQHKKTVSHHMAPQRRQG